MATVTPAQTQPETAHTEANTLVASVSVLMQGDFESIRRTVKHIAAQTLADQTELIIVALKGRANLPADPMLASLGRVTVVELENDSLGLAHAEGVRRAAAPVVILGEDHAWPEPRYVEALVAACKPPYTVVGPAMVNANPDSYISWANLLIAYGSWTAPVKSGPVKALPGTNSAYRRDVLLAYGDELDTLMAREGGLLRRLQQDGHQLYLAADARTEHQNISKFRSGVRMRFLAGRLYAAKRAHAGRWGAGKRAVYTLAAPLIPAVRFLRISQELRSRRFSLSPRIYAGVAFGVLFDGLGQMVGYAVGEGNAQVEIEDFEFNRPRYLSKRDRAQAKL